MAVGGKTDEKTSDGRGRTTHLGRLQHVGLGRQETERERENGVGTEERHYY